MADNVTDGLKNHREAFWSTVTSQSIVDSTLSNDRSTGLKKAFHCADKLMPINIIPIRE